MSKEKLLNAFERKSNGIRICFFILFFPLRYRALYLREAARKNPLWQVSENKSLKVVVIQSVKTNLQAEYVKVSVLGCSQREWTKCSLFSVDLPRFALSTGLEL